MFFPLQLFLFILKCYLRKKSFLFMCFSCIIFLYLCILVYNFFMYLKMFIKFISLFFLTFFLPFWQHFLSNVLLLVRVTSRIHCDLIPFIGHACIMLFIFMVNYTKIYYFNRFIARFFGAVS